MTGPVRISDHALLRYLDRVGGFEIDRLRAEIAARLAPLVGPLRGAVIIDGHAYVIEQDNGQAILVTVLPANNTYRCRVED